MTTNNGSMLALIDLNEITQWLHHCSYWCLVARSLCTFELLDVSPHLASQMSIHGGGLSGKDEWLNTFPKQERQNLSLQLSHRYKSLITLAGVASLGDGRDKLCRDAVRFLLPCEGNVQSVPHSHNLVWTCTAVTGTWEKKKAEVNL